ncbi:acyltransferase [Paucilactobacillus hokkaidonensis JCM 18461]|uniref:Acyltransferase n=3 Tax=Paucilactobacillus hokkaidonensis TaxID=1193095 RepID=A0A0A1GWV9_9LACO|nr:acyltransferase [Paucilactobacillus hokkaidonensis]KRO08031.1 acyltransferase [Paucilactobacillus hokkaidonensis]BAP84921.1 acyltransferase [Paucilactobacillus hokkaidonensis JCM 18461]
MAITHKRPYLYEVDLMRIIFIFGVLLNHTTTAFERSMAIGSNSQVFLQATHLILHFTRMGFMFMTGLVLVLNYYNRKNNWLTFWRKRYVSVGIPYVAWNGIFVLGTMIASGVALSGTNFWHNFGHALLYGDSFYMYYILVTFQLYLLFPLLVKLFKHFKHHLRIVLISMGVQLILLFFIKYGLPHIDRDSWWYIFRAYGVNVLVYQVYFVFGAFVAIHYHEVDEFIKRYAKAIGTLTAVLALGTIGLYFFNMNILHLTLAKTLEVHQPYIMIYDIVMIVFVFWLGRKYAYWREHGLSPTIDRFIRSGAKVSFGIYLVQTIPISLLTWLLSITKLPSWGYLILLPVGYAAVAAIAFAISWGCYKIYPFAYLIGRRPIKKRKEVLNYDKTYKPTNETTN